MGIFNLILGISLILPLLYLKSSLFPELNVILIYNSNEPVPNFSKPIYETFPFASTQLDRI